eukprot:comp23308_c0_seq1/m.38297 comp23308_c0_seq1/g.38297  ORF comp23308_c0_seq1/g.38297 comp23308_c0_seq1/m.38297 type:complete len:393 (-) comp23308_c0_seq1:948-2126(-)
MKRRADSEESDVGSEGEERQSERPAKKAHVDKLEDGVANGVEGENSEPGRDENEGRDNGMDQEDGEGLHSMKTEDGNENSENARVEVEKVGAVGNENEHVPGAVKVEPDSQTLWIGNIPQTWNSEKLKNYVSHFGEVFSVVTKKGYGFVQFVRRQDAEKCKTELHNKQSLVPNRRVIVNMARNEDEAGCQLQLKNVGTATEDTLKALLGKYGRVMSLSINRAHGRNTATAIMDSRRDTEIASVSLDKRMILEGSTQPLRVFPTVPINPTPPPRFQGHTHPFAMQQPYRPFFMPVLDRSGNGLTYPPVSYPLSSPVWWVRQQTSCPQAHPTARSQCWWDRCGWAQGGQHLCQQHAPQRNPRCAVQHVCSVRQGPVGCVHPWSTHSSENGLCEL